MNSLMLSLVKNSLLLLSLMFSISCQGPQRTSDSLGKSTDKVIQGVSGKVLFKEGSFASSGEIVGNGKVYGVERQILFYELTSIKDADIGEGDFVKNVSSEIVDSAFSDKHGNFSKELPTGKYSVFIKESKRLYSKLGENDYYFPLTISSGKKENIIIEVDYKATYVSGP